jgi:hypothetical protein
MRYAVVVFVLVLFSRPGMADVDVKSYERWDKAGYCRPNGFMVAKAVQCLQWAAASQCDSEYGLHQSWRTGLGRDDAWLRCANAKLERALADYNAARQATGAAFSRAGEALIQSDNSGRNVTCTRTSPASVNCHEW